MLLDKHDQCKLGGFIFATNIEVKVDVIFLLKDIFSKFETVGWSFSLCFKFPVPA